MGLLRTLGSSADPRGKRPLVCGGGGAEGAPWAPLSDPGRRVGAATGSGGWEAPSGIYPPPPPPLLTYTDLAHAQCAHELGWLGEGTGWHPHLKGQCQPYCSQEG